MDTAGRKTEYLDVEVVTAHELATGEDGPAPRVCRRGLRRRPEVGDVSEIDEIAKVVPAAARKGSESAAIRSTGIW